ncbi:hypothetical protein SERLA73DRAFT_180007 [Serpula lacrymans var. lacrymans S7.3]|uniref:Uncharacterized protein n=2 Tax=Serpula lacrymans var. lacrymans TaxID=341189 RepID=F8PV99_SERL3|nr:uncharacterized protein SERLADRAFT_465410 [Serpula lacrymans var. lacrymans S7.9]EGN99791.1 hypothetical protein SERLA73DRAFT_180007 [Serpula lacrymans var. lacrymans S7.3]EGO25364.1 hypothetical protein SERLADRAFT_465410 [Serpula lacrymans var. lacrymans S7.9]
MSLVISLHCHHLTPTFQAYHIVILACLHGPTTTGSTSLVTNLCHLQNALLCCMFLSFPPNGSLHGPSSDLPSPWKHWTAMGLHPIDKRRGQRAAHIVAFISLFRCRYGPSMNNVLPFITSDFCRGMHLC